MPLTVEQNVVKPGVVVVALAGRVMLGGESAQIENLVQKAIAEGQRHFIFDMTAVTHIDSTGIGRFISSLNKARSVGGTLRFAGATGQVRDAFHVTRLDTVFKFFDDVDKALQTVA